MTCPSCGTVNAADQKFCGECGARLAAGCPACGAENPPGHKFCSECGTALTAATAPSVAAPRTAPAPAAERRVVSVLFADLVGFTTASETRDAEETRELLTRYFDAARTTIERYGGTVEKFIGDAVMAVWGAPVAQEDDAERAVRAALDLVGGVAELDAALQARAGVSTGEAAVTIGADGQGMVAGDLVNTASRIQSASEPGQVVVGEATKRATEAAVAYADAGEHALKGKVEPVRLWRALRVVAGRGGALRSTALEAPFVGRDRELRLLKELFHASADGGKAHLVSVTGIAGIGKSRLSWEFEKYVDGLALDVFWHRGRCLSYGEGVAYWALAEMVRMRCDIVEDEEPDSARAKLHATIERHVRDEEERRWVEPRLAHLLGIVEGPAGDQENLFSAWRILFERLAEDSPTVLVFEDMQWADTGLLDFLEYLLDWSRGHPLFVLVLARPEFAERRASWRGGKRSFASLYLEPLAADAMEALLSGLVPGLPEDVRRRILARAEGVPLYAVETVRMLLDRGMLAQEDGVYRPSGPIEALEVPETLHALVAARLDGLAPDERRLVQDGAVLGKTFTKHGLVAVTGLDAGELEPLLASLLRKEILAHQGDPRSPERGQYAFIQDIVRHVAYETLARTERKAKHLAAAEFLLEAFGAEEDEIVEVVAAHYSDAYEAAPGAPDAAEIAERAGSTLARAGDRAASLGAHAEAQHAYERAAEFADDERRRADLLERAGTMASAAAHPEAAAAHFEHAIALFEDIGATHPAARVAARHAEILWERGRLEEGLATMDRSFELLAEEEADADLAALAAQLGRILFFAGRQEAAMQRVESALDMAEALRLPEVLSQALNTKALVLMSRGRNEESGVLLRHALHLALENEKPSAALRAYYNIADFLATNDEYGESAVMLREGLSLARRVGNRYWEYSLLGFAYVLYALGEWDEVVEAWGQLPDEADWEQVRLAFGAALNPVVAVYVHRGRLDEAERIVGRVAALATSADVQERAYYGSGASRLHLAAGAPARALELASDAFAAHEMHYLGHDAVKEAFVTACEAAFELNDLAAVQSLVEIVEESPPGRQPQFLQAQVARFRARLADRAGDAAEAARLHLRAVALLREIGVPFALAVALLEQAEWLAAHDHAADAEAPRAEALEIFARLDASPWIARTHRVPSREAVGA